MSERTPMPTLNTSGRERAQFGVIGTAQNSATGKTVSMHRAGPPTIAVAEIAAEVDKLGANWKIVSLSTPASVYRDLQGTRYHRIKGDARNKLMGRQSAHDARTQEKALLGRIGRLDLLSPQSFPA